MNIFGYQIEVALILSIIFGIAAILMSLFAWILPRRMRQKKELAEYLQEVEKAIEALENIKKVEKQFGIPIYVDGLPTEPQLKFDPFTVGKKLMEELKWEDAIIELKKAMTEVKASQLVLVYNLIGICNYNMDRYDLAIDNFTKSLNLARDFSDKEGEIKALKSLEEINKVRGREEKS